MQLIGQLRNKAVEAIRIDLLSRYMWTISGSGQHSDWICVPSASALVRKGDERLARKVLKAKVLAGILGTMETKLMRGHASLDESLRCRMCERNLESISHVLWECQDESVAGPRRMLVES